MRTGRPKQPLTVTSEERRRLESLAHRARSQPCWLVVLGWCWAVLKDWITKRSPRSCAARWTWWASGGRASWNNAWQDYTTNHVPERHARSAMIRSKG
jgi:hypothetical protein